MLTHIFQWIEALYALKSQIIIQKRMMEEESFEIGKSTGSINDVSLSNRYRHRNSSINDLGG